MVCHRTFGGLSEFAKQNALYSIVMYCIWSFRTSALHLMELSQECAVLYGTFAKVRCILLIMELSQKKNAVLSLYGTFAAP